MLIYITDMDAPMVILRSGKEGKYFRCHRCQFKTAKPKEFRRHLCKLKYVFTYSYVLMCCKWSSTENKNTLKN